MATTIGRRMGGNINRSKGYAGIIALGYPDVLNVLVIYSPTVSSKDFLLNANKSIGSAILQL
jgi:hypothetical protein